MPSLKQTFLLLCITLLMAVVFTGCNAIGMLLFYKEVKTEEVYRSSTSVKNYYIIKATTFSHCGCTELHICNYQRGKKTFRIDYRDSLLSKTIYRYNEATKKRDTIRLIATRNDFFATPFDSLDREIIGEIQSLHTNKTKGIVYPVKKPDFKGFDINPIRN